MTGHWKTCSRLSTPPPPLSASEADDLRTSGGSCFRLLRLFITMKRLPYTLVQLRCARSDVQCRFNRITSKLMCLGNCLCVNILLCNIHVCYERIWKKKLIKWLSSFHLALTSIVPGITLWGSLFTLNIQLLKVISSTHLMSEFPWDFLYLFIPLIFLCTFILCLLCFIAFFPLLKDPKDTFWTFLLILLKSYRWIIDTSNFIVTTLTFFFLVTFSSLVEIKLCDSAFCALLDVHFPLSVASIGENFILFLSVKSFNCSKY